MTLGEAGIRSKRNKIVRIPRQRKMGLISFTSCLMIGIVWKSNKPKKNIIVWVGR